MLQEFYQANSAVLWLASILITFVFGVWVPGYVYRKLEARNEELLELVTQGSNIRTVLMQEVAARPDVHVKPVSHTYDKLYVKELLRRLVAQFSEDEIKELAFNMDIEWENLGGNGKAGKALEFVKFVERQGRVGDLETEVLKVRPNFFLSTEAL
jgi:hypothetical protein